MLSMCAHISCMHLFVAEACWTGLSFRVGHGVFRTRHDRAGDKRVMECTPSSCMLFTSECQDFFSCFAGAFCWSLGRTIADMFSSKLRSCLCGGKPFSSRNCLYHLVTCAVVDRRLTCFAASWRLRGCLCSQASGRLPLLHCVALAV